MRILFSRSNFHLSDGDEESSNDILFALELTGAERDFVSIYGTYTHAYAFTPSALLSPFAEGCFFCRQHFFSPSKSPGMTPRKNA
jgi:hypothetical protein